MDTAANKGLLAGRRAIVTGAAQGIGAGVAEALQSAGASVTRTDLHPGEGIAVCDVTDEAAVARLFDEITASGELHDVVHAAGIAKLGSVAEMSVADFRMVMEVNLIGSFIVAQQAAHRLAPGGNLVLIASQAGLKGGALWSAYSASKAAVLRLADCLVEELAERRIRVNCISPGNVDTRMMEAALTDLARRKSTTAEALRNHYIGRIPMGRFADAEEVGNSVVALCSHLLSYANGINLVLDGGELSR